MKVVYFDLFARAEPIRMMLSYAKVPFEDVRINGEQLKTMKEEGQLEYGQVPYLELDDGTKLFQSIAIFNYVASTYGFHPQNPLDVHRGESIHEAIIVDFAFKVIPSFAFSPPSPERDAKMVEVAEKYQVAAGHLARVLSQREDKFICGNKLTAHDFTVGGIWLNLFTNPNSKDPEFWAKCMEASPERVKKYVTDLKEELKEYLAAREVHKCTL